MIHALFAHMLLVKIETRRWMSGETKCKLFDETHAAGAISAVS